MASSPARRRPLAFVSSVVLVCSLANASPVRPHGAQDGHARMVSELADLARTRAQQMGREAEHDRLMRLRQGIPAGVSPQRLAGTLGQLAVAGLRAGRFEAARETFAEILALVPRMPAASGAGVAALAEYFTGVAWMREAMARECSTGRQPGVCSLGSGATAGAESAEDLERALQHLRRAIVAGGAESPVGIASSWLGGVAVEMGGSGSGDWPSIRAVLAGAPFPRFRDVAPALGIDVFDYAGGMVVDDFDGDGLLDLFSTTTDIAGQARLFRNRGDGTFQERTGPAGLAGITGGLNAVQADYDDDGDLDLLILRGAWRGAKGRWPNSLLRNDGSMRFRDVTYEVGLAEPRYPTQVGIWADYDNDGDLDLYIANESMPDAPAPSQLFRNDGGRFVDVAPEAGVTNDRWGKSAAWGDYDDDGWIDLYVSNLHGPNRLYRNRRDGTFEDVAPRLRVHLPTSSFPTWFSDVDEDGNLDLIVNSYQMRRAGSGGDIWHAAADRLDAEHSAELSRLYLGTDAGDFVEAGTAWGIARSNLPMAANYGDLDNDGRIDFYLGTGYPGFEGLFPNLMYRNDGGRRFVEVSLSGGFATLAKGHGIAFADLDHDGDQDVVEQLGGFLPGDQSHNALFENPGAPGNWIVLELRGVEANSFGVGARVEAELPAGSEPRRLHRVVGTGASFGGNPLRVHLGLGPADHVAGVTIRWPGGGRQQIGRLDAGAHYRVVEGESEPRRLERPAFSLGGR